MLPVARGYRQPLAAGYRTSLAGLVEKLLGEGDLRPGMLFRHCRVTQLDDDALLADPDAGAARPGSGLAVSTSTSPRTTRPPCTRPEPEVLVERFGALAQRRAAGATHMSARPPSARPLRPSESPSIGTSSRPSTATR